MNKEKWDGPYTRYSFSATNGHTRTFPTIFCLRPFVRKSDILELLSIVTINLEDSSGYLNMLCFSWPNTCGWDLTATAPDPERHAASNAFELPSCDTISLSVKERIASRRSNNTPVA